jgi:hypothetical protein
MFMYEIEGIGQVYSEYRRRDLPGKGVIVGQSAISESELERTVSITDDGRVFHNDHVQLGVIRSGRFVADRWAFKVFSMADLGKVRRHLELTWCFRAENLDHMVKVTGSCLYHGAALIADRAACAEKWVVSERALSIYSRRQVAAIIGAAG